MRYSFLLYYRTKSMIRRLVSSPRRCDLTSIHGCGWQCLPRWWLLGWWLPVCCVSRLGLTILVLDCLLPMWATRSVQMCRLHCCNVLFYDNRVIISYVLCYARRIAVHMITVTHAVFEPPFSRCTGLDGCPEFPSTFVVRRLDACQNFMSSLTRSRKSPLYSFITVHCHTELDLVSVIFTYSSSVFTS